MFFSLDVMDSDPPNPSCESVEKYGGGLFNMSFLSFRAIFRTEPCLGERVFGMFSSKFQMCFLFFFNFYPLFSADSRCSLCAFFVV